MPEGFALDEYVTPRGEVSSRVPGGTIPKAAKDDVSSQAHSKSGGAVPGPGQYDLEKMDQKARVSKGNTFSKLSRDARLRLRTTPAVGQYQTAAAMVLTSPRIVGGPISKSSKGCAIIDMVERKSKHMPDPGKYEPNPVKEHVVALPFNPDKTPSKPTYTKVPPGPGTYEPNYALTEQRRPAYTASKEKSKSHLEALQREKAKIPAPGFAGIPDSKNLDRKGYAKHAQVLLKDH